MKDFRAVQFWWLSQELLRYENELTGPIDHGKCADLSAFLEYAKGQFDYIGLKLSASPTPIALLPLCSIGSELQKLQMVVGHQVDVEHLKRKFGDLRKNLEIELSKYRFVLVPEDKVKYFEQEKLFGDVIYDKFENARQDIKEAGNCLAAGLPLACVFHLMRVAEIGLRHIATKVGVKLQDKGQPQPIEYATWDKVLNGIQSEIGKAKALPQGPRKARRLTFFQEAAEHCSYLQAIRNEVSHTRKRYNEHEAMGAMQRVKSLCRICSYL